MWIVLRVIRIFVGCLSLINYYVADVVFQFNNCIIADRWIVGVNVKKSGIIFTPETVDIGMHLHNKID